MKKTIVKGLFLALIGPLFLTSCKKNETDTSSDSFVPIDFVVDIPESISRLGNSSGLRTLNTDSVKFDGKIQYESLRAYIGVGEQSARVIQKVLSVSNKLLKNKISSLTFKSDDDGREKIITVIEKSFKEGKTWQYELTVVDKLSGKLALQAVFDKTDSQGITVMDPDELNYTDTVKNVMYRCDFSSKSLAYDKYMEVRITNPSNNNGLKAFQMKVFKKGDIVEVTGTSYHPTLKIDSASSTDPGLCYAFVAKGDQKNNYGVAKAGFPYANVDSDTDLDKTYNLTWLYRESYKHSKGYANQSDADIDKYIRDNGANLDSPGFFKNDGLVSSGSNKPTEFSSQFITIDYLKPLKPLRTKELIIEFLN